jgi:hypothetical protein
MASVSTSTAMQVDSPPHAKRSRGESLLADFGSYRKELDAHVSLLSALGRESSGLMIFLGQHDRRERIIKLSRDVTALSKKLIFVLHRSVFRLYQRTPL